MSYSKVLFPTLIIALFYFILITLLMNNSLVKDTFTGIYGLEYKIKIVAFLLQGMWTSMSGIGLFLLMATAVLTGANITLFTQKLKDLKKQGNFGIKWKCYIFAA